MKTRNAYPEQAYDDLRDAAVDIEVPEYVPEGAVMDGSGSYEAAAIELAPPTDEASEISAENIPSAGLTWSGASPDQVRFMRRVYDAHVARASRSRSFTPDVPAADLSTVEGRHRARTAAATACRDLLREARSAIRTQAVAVEVGITSAYRSASRQFTLWQSYFPDYYRRTQAHRRGLTGGEHGSQAVRYMVRFVGARIAAPGYSMHNSGLAIDFRNVQDGRTLRNRTTSSATRAWRRSWFWDWLTANAARFGYYQNTSIDEPWHWEYRAGAGAGAALKAGSAAVGAITQPLSTAFSALKSFVKNLTDYAEGRDLDESPTAAAVSAGAAVASLGFEILKTTINTFREGDVTLIKPTSQVGVIAMGTLPSWVRRNTKDRRKVVFRTRESNPFSGIEQVHIELECIVQYNGPEVKASFNLTPRGARSRLGRDTKITINNPLDLRTRRASAAWRGHGIEAYPEVRVPITVRVDRPWPMENWNWSFDLMLSGMYGIGVNRNGRLVIKENVRRYNN
jgi:LAS superfamily LD-carboxypeptidase LdcB